MNQAVRGFAVFLGLMFALPLVVGLPEILQMYYRTAELLGGDWPFRYPAIGRAYFLQPLVFYSFMVIGLIGSMLVAVFLRKKGLWLALVGTFGLFINNVVVHLFFGRPVSIFEYLLPASMVGLPTAYLVYQHAALS